MHKMHEDNFIKRHEMFRCNSTSLLLVKQSEDAEFNYIILRRLFYKNDQIGMLCDL